MYQKEEKIWESLHEMEKRKSNRSKYIEPKSEFKQLCEKKEECKKKKETEEIRVNKLRQRKIFTLTSSNCLDTWLNYWEMKLWETLPKLFKGTGKCSLAPLWTPMAPERFGTANVPILRDSFSKFTRGCSPPTPTIYNVWKQLCGVVNRGDRDRPGGRILDRNLCAAEAAIWTARDRLCFPGLKPEENEDLQKTPPHSLAALYEIVRK